MCCWIRVSAFRGTNYVPTNHSPECDSLELEPGGGGKWLPSRVAMHIRRCQRCVCRLTDLEVGMPQVQIDPISTVAGQLQPPEILTLLVT